MDVLKVKSLAAAVALACVMAMGAGSRAEDAGELFPNVKPYDETVASPISKPEVKKVDPSAVTPAPVPPKVEPAPPTVPVTPPEAGKAPDDGSPTDVVPGVPDNRKPPVKKKPPVRLTTQPATLPSPPPPPLVEFTPYRELLMRPMVSPADAKAFAEGFADPITEALAGTPEQRKRIADLLESSAQSVASPELKRDILLHAFGLYVRAGLPAAEREQKAQALLPLLTDATLPVMQARADALNDLYLTFSANPNDTFLNLYADAYARLTRYRVQAGFPNEAQDSLKKAREGGSHLVKKSQVRTEEINEAAAWADRARAAAKLAPGYQAKLKTNPDDPVVNTMMATLHLSLYGDLERAMGFAAKSDRKDLKELAAVLQANRPRSLSKDPAKHAEQVLAIGKALVEVAKGTPASQPFDRYSIACFAGDHVSQVIDDGVMPAAKILEAKILLANAKDIVDKTYLKRGDDVPKWLGGTGGNGVAGDTSAGAKHTLSAVADFFKGLPKELVPLNVGWTRGQLTEINAWMAKTQSDQVFDAQVQIDRVDPPVDALNGKRYVPVMFEMPNLQVKDQLWVRTFVEVRMSPTVATRAQSLVYGQSVQVQGTVQSVRISEYSSFAGEPTFVSLRVVVINKE